jgi:hypothetical protein
MLVKKVVGLAQRNGDDKTWGKKVSQITKESKENTDCKRPREITIIAERPCTESELDEWVTFEAEHRAAQTIDCEVTVRLVDGGEVGRTLEARSLRPGKLAEHRVDAKTLDSIGDIHPEQPRGDRNAP